MVIAAPIISIILGLIWAIKGVGYGFWVNNGPGGGFFPIIAGIILIICGVLAVFSQLKAKAPSDFKVLAFLPIGCVLLIAFSSYVLGLLIAIGIFTFLWLKLYEKYTIKYSLLFSLCSIGVIYLVFDYWLQVPMPWGIFEKLIY
ncbi:MAG: Tripartite tricarboxylate transporter TctB family protein [Clostridiales bacterium]|jgi:hypothetical protein|nr:Tripartite tricarboxylate transporter TctB family protein [Clostridiales bacterium]